MLEPQTDIISSCQFWIRNLARNSTECWRPRTLPCFI